MKDSISSILWLYLPIAFIIVQIILELVLEHTVLSPLHSETGPHEALQSVIALFAFLLALRLLFQIDWVKQKLVGIAIAIAGIGSLYIVGEELSWGQHVMDWSTPYFWAQYNDQNETNLHNVSSWLDQKPRLIVYIGIIIAGLLIPFLRRFKITWVPQKFLPLYPSNRLVPTALLVLLPSEIQRFLEFAGKGFFTRVSEVQEIYMYFFIFLYLLDLRNREISKVNL